MTRIYAINIYIYIYIYIHNIMKGIHTGIYVCTIDVCIVVTVMKGWFKLWETTPTKEREESSNTSAGTGWMDNHHTDVNTIKQDLAIIQM